MIRQNNEIISTVRSDDEIVEIKFPSLPCSNVRTCGPKYEITTKKNDNFFFL